MIKLIEGILENEGLLDFIISEGCIVLSMYDPYEAITLNPKLYKVDLRGVEDLQDLQWKLRVFLDNTPNVLEQEKTLELYSKVLLPLYRELVDKCEVGTIICKKFHFFSTTMGDKIEWLNSIDFIDKVVKLYNETYKYRDYDCSWISN
jgi:hypothetical protein